MTTTAILILFAIIIDTAVLWHLGWRPYTCPAAEYFFDGDLKLLLVAGDRELFGVGAASGMKAKHGGREGGRLYIVLFGRIFGMWRDPYRSKNSGDYMVDKNK